MMAKQGKRGYFGILPTLLYADGDIPVWLKIIASLLALPEELAGWPPGAITNVRRIAEHFHSKRTTVRKALSFLQQRGWLVVEKISYKRIRIQLTEKFIEEVVEASPSPRHLEIYDFWKPVSEKKQEEKPAPQYTQTRKRILSILSSSHQQKTAPIDISNIPDDVLENVLHDYYVHIEDLGRTSPDWLYWALKKAIAQLEKNEK